VFKRRKTIFHNFIEIFQIQNPLKFIYFHFFIEPFLCYASLKLAFFFMLRSIMNHRLILNELNCHNIFLLFLFHLRVIIFSLVIIYIRNEVI